MKPYESPWMDDDLRMLREAISRFVESEMLPRDAEWRKRLTAEQYYILRRHASNYGYRYI